jgi:hypothetical protein
MPEKLKSRKLLLSLAGFISVFLAEVAGVDLSTETIIGLLGVIGVYVGSEALVDKGAVVAAAEAAKDEAYQGVVMYARSLEARLAQLGETANPPE